MCLCVIIHCLSNIKRVHLCTFCASLCVCGPLPGVYGGHGGADDCVLFTNERRSLEGFWECGRCFFDGSSSPSLSDGIVNRTPDEAV